VAGMKGGKLINLLSDYQLLKKDLVVASGYIVSGKTELKLNLSDSRYSRPPTLNPLNKLRDAYLPIMHSFHALSSKSS
jgi:hypothetical protein